MLLVVFSRYDVMESANTQASRNERRENQVMLMLANEMSMYRMQISECMRYTERMWCLVKS